MPAIGLNIAGGEFGSSGVHNDEYHYPSYVDLKFYADKGVDLIRVPFRWERVQDALGGALDLSGDLALIKQVLVDAAALGMDVILDCHNYGRFKGVAIGASGGPTATQFASFWQKMATELKGYPALAGYDLMNEPHDMPTSTIWKEAAQAATTAIRKVDMSNTILVEGNAWSGAHSWQKYNSDLIISDPANNIVYQAHQYFDDDSSGTYGESYAGEAADPLVGVRRLAPFVEWLEANNFKGMIGETGVPSNDPRWIEVMKNALDYMVANNLDVTAWAGGTWWGESYSMYVGKPGTEDSALGNLLERYYNKFDGFGTERPSTYNTPTITLNNATANEGGTITFTVTRSGNLTGSSTVHFATSKGTASAVSDFSSKAGTLTFAAGETNKTVTVTTSIDSVAEASETMKINLSAGSNVRIWDALGIGTIQNSTVALAAPSIALSDATANEANGTITFTATRSGDLARSSSVGFATANATALAGSDYMARTDMVSFAAGETKKSISVTIINDTAIENSETLKVNLTSGTNASIADGLGVGTIDSDDGALAAPTHVITGTAAGETINGTDRTDSIYAEGGNDTINGSGGADYMHGGDGSDTVSYHASGAAVNVDLTRTLQQGSDAQGDQLVSVGHLTGSAYSDLLKGNHVANNINGNGGRDALTGGTGSDRFIFDSSAEANGDIVRDFKVGEDKLDFRSIDANAVLVGNQSFAWLDASAFTGKAGELREYNLDGKHFVAGDSNGDRISDFTIEVAGTTNLTSIDILF